MVAGPPAEGLVWGAFWQQFQEKQCQHAFSEYLFMVRFIF
jgi:hypothetical protein